MVSAAGAAVLSRGVTAVATLLTFAVAADTLETAELGVVAVLTALGVFLGLGDLGLGILLLSRVPTARARGDARGAQEVTGATLGTLTAVGLLVAAAGAASAYLLDWPSLLGARALPEAPVRLAVVCMFVAGGLAIPASVGGRVLAATLRTATAHVFNAVAGLAALGLTVACAQLDAPVWAYVAAIVGTPTAVWLVQTAWVLTRVHPELRPPSLLPARATARALLRDTTPYAVISASVLVAFCIDSLVVSSLLGAEAAATFALAARLFALVGTTLSLAGQQMWSAMADAVTRGDWSWVRARFGQSLVVLTALDAVGCLVLVVAGRTLTELWLGEEVVPPWSLLVVLAVWTVYSTSLLQASYLLIAMERVRELAIAYAVMAPLNLGLSLLLTRWVGLTGPTLGNIAALTVTVAVPTVLLTRRALRGQLAGA